MRKREFEECNCSFFFCFFRSPLFKKRKTENKTKGEPSLFLLISSFSKWKGKMEAGDERISNFFEKEQKFLFKNTFSNFFLSYLKQKSERIPMLLFVGVFEEEENETGHTNKMEMDSASPLSPFSFFRKGKRRKKKMNFHAILSFSVLSSFQKENRGEEGERAIFLLMHADARVIGGR
jgi:hypothetical protein